MFSDLLDPDPSNHAKIVKKTLISTALLLLFDFLSLKNDVNVPSKSNKQKNLSEAWIRGSRSGSGSTPNVMDPQHCRKLCMIVYLARVGKEDGPGVGEDDKPHASRHCEVIHLVVHAELKGAHA
jgi:hypothetical protein